MLARSHRMATWQVSSRSDPSKDYKIGICCYSTKYAAFRSYTKELARSESGLCVPV